MIRRFFAGFALAAVAVVGTAIAHDGHDHGKKLMGTVKAVHAQMNHVEITTAKGTSDFYVNASTRYVRGASRLTLADLKPGTRVVVDVKSEGGKTTAIEVRLAGKPGGTAGNKK
jgi:hypothetical protein